MYNQNDDLRSAIEYNRDGLVGFNEQEIEEIVAEVVGEHDGDSWWWIVRLSTGKFALLTGGCDYTGWDCQSDLKTIAVADTALELAKQADPKKYDRRDISRNLVGQIMGTQPKFTYTP